MAEKNNHQSQCILFGPSCKSKDFEYHILKTNPDLVLHWLHNLIVACCLLLRQSVVAFNLRSVNFKFFSLFLHFWTPTYIRKEHFSPDYIRFGATLEPQAENFSSSCGHHQSTGYHVDTEANKSLDTRLKQVFFIVWNLRVILMSCHTVQYTLKILLVCCWDWVLFNI